MSKDKQTPKELKVTDKRIFTADGEIRDEFKQEIRADAPPARATIAEPRPEPAPEPPPAPAAEPPARSADPGANPGTAFTNFAEGLIVQAYMSLGMLRNPYQPQSQPDPAVARQMIDLLTMLKEKTANNLTPDESDFLESHLGELKLAFVQRTKSI
ncbi:MAG TPA: DUF1844 domain-containing protein [Thermoanaerobaculia bacterium]